MSATTHPRPGFLRRRPLATAAAAAAVIAVAAGVAVGLLSGGVAFAATKPTWFMTAGNIQSLSAADPATTAHFFNTPAAYGAGASLVHTPVQAGYATTPVLSFSSYAQFSADLKTSAISYPYKWVMYDPEDWAQTPAAEQDNPLLYMKLFGQLAHTHGLKAIEAPAIDLCSVTATKYPRQPGENCTHWYTRVNIAAAAATDADIYVLQDESNLTNLAIYDSMYDTTATQARTANPAIKVYSEVSTANGTPTQMAAAARSISPDGMYVAAPGATTQASQFFHTMKTAGY